jgi:glycine/D-amino acid oxidase-like deaminating enzyme
MAGRNKSQNLWHVTSRETVSTRPLKGDVTADVVIIGGGFTGCSAALHAAEAGAKVVLLEASVIGHGASGRNVGLVNAGLWTPPDEVEAMLGKEAGIKLNSALAAGPALVSDLIDKHQIACDPERVGSLHLAHSLGGLNDLIKRCQQQQARGAPVTLLTRDETARRTGTQAFYGALHDQRALIIQPFAYCRGLARAAIAAGASLHEASPVLAATSDSGKWVVETDAGRVTADKLICATDAYHSAISGLKVPEPVSAGYFQVATRPLSASALERILPGKEGCWDTATVMSSVRLDRDGRLVVGAAGSLSHLGASVHTNWAYRKMVALYPFLKGEAIEHAWYGTIGMTSDHLPRVYRISDSAYGVFGYSGRGIAPGTVFGRAVAHALLRNTEDELPVTPVTAYSQNLKRTTQAYYETGCVAMHLVAERI